MKIQCNSHIFTTKNKKEAFDIDLLLQSKSIPFIIIEGFSNFSFFVPQSFTKIVTKEIDIFLKENGSLVKRPENWLVSDFEFSYISLGIIIFLSAFYRLTQKQAFFSYFFDSGRFSAEAVLENGEWARLITSLTLHVDDTHVLGNCVGLLLFVTIVSQTTGVGIAWLTTLLSGLGGNFLNTLFYKTSHFSVGASTSIFGALGIAAGIQVRKTYLSIDSIKKNFIILSASTILLVFLGSGEGSDVTAHLFGFITGIIIGICTGSLITKKTVSFLVVQICALFIFFSLIISAWSIQLYF